MSVKVSDGLRYRIAVACKDYYNLLTIDDLFLANGCETQWWVEPSNPSTSQRMNRAFGWFEGIRRFARGRELDVVCGVARDILGNPEVDTVTKAGIQEFLDGSRSLQRVLSPETDLGRYNFHPAIIQAASQLFADGHYSEAIFRTSLALIERVKQRTGRCDIDTTALMQYAFSSKRPVLRLSHVDDEQLGFQWLFSGAVMAIRNPRAHRLDHAADHDPDRVLEWLAFLSALFRLVDEAEYIGD